MFAREPDKLSLEVDPLAWDELDKRDIGAREDESEQIRTPGTQVTRPIRDAVSRFGGFETRFGSAGRIESGRVPTARGS